VSGRHQTTTSTILLGGLGFLTTSGSRSDDFNQNRSYDSDRRRVRFWGAIEVSFFLDEAALFKLYPWTKNAESGILAAFDAARERILEVAGKVYAPRQQRSFYILAAADF
jgi:hypothetical protein